MKVLSPIIFIMGVSGSGKSTVGSLLSAETGIPFFDGDDYHPQSNIEKMASGNPLNDHDREAWLLRLNALARAMSREDGAIIACSALKEQYRSMLEKQVGSPVSWIYLEGSFEQVSERLEKRKGHFMPPALLRSQFETLQVPGNALSINIKLPPTEITEKIRMHLGL